MRPKRELEFLFKDSHMRGKAGLAKISNTFFSESEDGRDSVSYKRRLSVVVHPKIHSQSNRK